MAGGSDSKDGKAANSTNDTKAAGGVDSAPPVQYQFAQKPVELPGWLGVKRFIWNTETKEFMGRTGCSWCKSSVSFIITFASFVNKIR